MKAPPPTNPRPPFHRRRLWRGFTLVEIMVSTAILSLLLMLVISVLDQTQRSWQQSRSRVEQFRDARVAFELLTRNLSQATLNTYWDYFYVGQDPPNQPPPVTDGAAPQPPDAYMRMSELQFRVDQTTNLLSGNAAQRPGHAVFFQAPLGLTVNPEYRSLSNLLNARGYFVQFGSDEDLRPGFLGASIEPRHRYRLFEYRPPAEAFTAGGQSYQGNTIYVNPDGWYQDDVDLVSRPIADNIILLMISPQVSEEATAARQPPNNVPYWIAPQYRYNSLDPDNSTSTIAPVTVDPDTSRLNQGTQHLMPPLLKVTMVALDEASAQRWNEDNNNTAVDILQQANAPFTNVANYDDDLERLQDYLNDQRLNYRVFTSTVGIRSAKWDGRTF